jgi:hypothetical protein
MNNSQNWANGTRTTNTRPIFGRISSITPGQRGEIIESITDSTPDGIISTAPIVNVR